MINMRFNETRIEKRHLPHLMQEDQPTSTKTLEEVKEVTSLQDQMAMHEKAYIESVIRKNKGNKVQTAKDLEISIRNLYYKLTKYQIEE